MGFFQYDDDPQEAKPTSIKGISIESIRKLGCRICPLAKNRDAVSPDMKPSGADDAPIYFLGSQPLETDDRKDEHFRGESGAFLRDLIPDAWEDAIRFNYVVRTRTPGDRAPEHIEIECCRASVESDIIATAPEVIFAFGPHALKWLTDMSQKMNDWRGKRCPVKIGDHTMWAYFFESPRDILDKRRFTPRKKNEYGSDDEFAFVHDLRRAFADVKKGLPKPRVHSFDDALANIDWVTGAKRGDFDKVMDHIEAAYDAEVVGFDYETNGLRPYKKGRKILTVAIALPDRSLAFPLHHSETQFSAKQIRQIEDALVDWMIASGKNVEKAVHNLAFEHEWSGVNFGREVLFAKGWHCTQAQSFIMDTRPGVHSLDFRCRTYFGLPIKSMFELDKLALDNTPLETVLKYNAVDAKYHRLVHRVQMAELEAMDMLWVYREHMRRVVGMTLNQMRGVPVDQAVVDKHHAELTKQIKAIERKIENEPVYDDFKRKFGYKFEPTNTHHVRRLFSDMLGLDLEKSEKEVEKTDKKTLEKIKEPMAKLVLEHREAVKLRDIYVEVCRPGSEHLYDDGCMHPTISTTKVRTGRTSSEDPNIQNWPKRGSKKYIRKQVAVPDDKVIVAIDYAGIQGRNVAMESLDRKLVDQFWNKYDIHSDWMRRLLKIVPSWHDVPEKDDPKEWKEKRNIVKNGFVFPTFFGSFPKSLARNLKIDVKDAEKLRDEFFTEYSDIHEWHKELKRLYLETGYVTGLSGYRRYAPISPNEMINSPIQADEAVIVCAAQEALARRSEDLTSCMMIHDDLTFIWPRKKLDEYIDIAVYEMTKLRFDWINVPIEVEVSIGSNWADLEEIGKFEWGPGWDNYREIKK